VQQQSLTFLVEAGRRLNRTLDLHSIYGTLYDEVAQVMACDSIIVSRFDAHTSLIYCEYIRNEQGELDVSGFPPIPLGPDGQGTQSRAIHSHQSQFLPDFEQVRRSTRTSYYVSPEGELVDSIPEDAPRTRSALITPLILEQQVIGVIQVQSYRKKAHTRRHLHLLEALAQHVATATTNAQLYQRAQAEVLERRRTEAELCDLLREKEALLGEVHHRVKNNLQSIISLMGLRMNQVPDADTRSFLSDMQQQARTMALVYDQFSHAEKLAQVEMTTYLEQIAHYLLENAAPAVLPTVAVTTVAASGAGQPLLMAVSAAMPCGLLMNELLSNAIKHAFSAPVAAPCVQVLLEERADEYCLRVSDNGVGLPPGLDPYTGGSLGLQLVNLWATHQLCGRLEVSAGLGACFEITFPKERT
jgi:two-component sensor histidine kinase